MSGPSEQIGIREQLLLGALRQGPSFVILLAILFGLYRAGDFLIREGISRGIDQIKAGYREMQDQHSANLRDVITAFEREQERRLSVMEVMKEVAESRAVMLRTLDLVEQMESRWGLESSKEEVQP
ncbi:hypothetical protein K2X85_08070 [bacterium]|jgi:hypothetical protein|nr:hypothetical protein [bacterium]